MKRSIILLLLTAVGLSIKAQETVFSVGNLYYRIIMPNEVEVVLNPDGCTYYRGDIVVPDSVQYNGVYYKVTSLGNYAFNSSRLNTLSLPNGIRSIGEYCFYFSHISGHLELPDSLRVIKQYAFSSNNTLSSINIPPLVDSIGFRAFSPMQGLHNIVVDSANEHYCSYNGVLYSKDMTTLLCCPSGKTGEVFTIPNGVTYISDLAIELCGFTSVEIPNTVTTIKNAAFSESERLTSIHIPASVTHLEGGIFRGCKRLNNLTIDSLNTSYKLVDGALYSINMDTILSHHLASDTVILPQSVKVIGMETFSFTTNLKTVILPQGVEHIQEGGFYACGLRAITLPESLKSIGEWGFKSCEYLSSIKIPNSVTYLGEGVFSETGLTSVVMSDSVKVIPSSAFEFCTSLRTYAGGSSVEKIESLAFLYCVSLPTTIQFPASLKVLQSYAFERVGIRETEFTGVVDTIGMSNFSDLRKLILHNQVPPFTYNTPISGNDLQVIIPCGATEAYMANPNWSSYSYTEDCDGVEENPMSAVKVTAGYRSIEVLNAEGYPVAIYDIMGRCHASEGATGQNIRHYSLPTAGVYVVRVNDRGYKVIVR